MKRHVIGSCGNGQALTQLEGAAFRALSGSACRSPARGPRGTVEATLLISRVLAAKATVSLPWVSKASIPAIPPCITSKLDGSRVFSDPNLRGGLAKLRLSFSGRNASVQHDTVTRLLEGNSNSDHRAASVLVSSCCKPHGFWELQSTAHARSTWYSESCGYRPWAQKFTAELRQQFPKGTQLQQAPTVRLPALLSVLLRAHYIFEQQLVAEGQVNCHASG